MKNNSLKQSTQLKKPQRATVRHTLLLIIFAFVLVTLPVSCGVYSFTGAATNAKTISFIEFYNNTDLGPANMGQTFTNSIKNYFIQNSSLSVVAEEGELQLEGEITDFRLTPIAPVASGDPNLPNAASSTRLTINIKVTYVNTLDDKLSFKNKSFSFYKDFPNESNNLSDVQEQYIKEIFDRLINDIFNATVANW